MSQTPPSQCTLDTCHLSEATRGRWGAGHRSCVGSALSALAGAACASRRGSRAEEERLAQIGRHESLRFWVISKSCTGCAQGGEGGGSVGQGVARLGRQRARVTTSRVCVLAFSLPVSKKLAPIPPKVPFGQPGAVADQPAGQPSPLSLSPTPPSTPSPYGLSYPQGYSLASGQLSPAAAAPALASPSGFTSATAKSRPTPKPRQRPTLPPPQPPTVSLPAPSPQSTEHPVLDGVAPGESMSTGNRAAAPACFSARSAGCARWTGSLAPLSFDKLRWGPGSPPPILPAPRGQWIQVVPREALPMAFLPVEPLPARGSDSGFRSEPGG